MSFFYVGTLMQSNIKQPTTSCEFAYKYFTALKIEFIIYAKKAVNHSQAIVNTNAPINRYNFLRFMNL